MYETFFHLKESPFQLTPDPQFFYLSRQHEDALAHLSFGVRERKGFMVLTGEIGTGKTTLSRLFLTRLSGGTKTSLIFNPSLTPTELLQAINQDFGISPEGDSKKELVDRLNHFLLKEISNGGNAVLLIDEAQNLTVECIEEIRLLSNLETEKDKLLQIILVGQPELQQKLNLPELRQFNQRVAMRYHLQPLTEEETEGYILYRLRMAGGPGKIQFSREAYQKIYQFSAGFPRLINLLCDKSLLAAYVTESELITGPMADRAILEISGGFSTNPPDNPSVAKSGSPTPRRWTSSPWFWSGLSAGVAMILGFGLWLGQVRMEFGEESKPPPASPAPATTPDAGGEIKVQSVSPAPATTPDTEGRFDTDGVFRVMENKNTLFASYLTLLHLWGRTVPSADEALREMGTFLSPVSVGALQGFLTYVTPLDFHLIEVLDYPVLLNFPDTGGGNRYVVLAGLTDDEVTILDPMKGKARYTLREFQERSTGEGYIWWKAAGGIRFPFRTYDWDISIQKLQEILKGWGYYQGVVDGFVGTGTQAAVAAFWKERGVSVDRVSPEIFMAVSKQMLGGTVPSLKSAPDENSLDSLSNRALLELKSIGQIKKGEK